ncbi:MAG: STAS domain-containing protein [Gemmatimonadetes bacterium]|nr:STAS domain-containing protein [Gemmatimonadota bacterium]
MSVQVKWERKDGILIAMLVGHIDSSNADRFQRIVESGIDSEDRALILDFERVSYISSAGLRVGLIMAKQFKAPGKQFGICALSDSVREVVVASGFDEIISIYESQDAAIGEFKKN